jgi:hypothetical protein
MNVGVTGMQNDAMRERLLRWWGACVIAALAVSGGVQAEEAEPSTDLPETVTRLDAERRKLAESQLELNEQAADLRREASELERRRQELLRKLDAEGQALKAREQANAEQVAKQAETMAAHAAEIEHVLRAGGKWVSFTDQIAPLLRAKCVACHSAREPGGGHVLTSYAGLFSAGANGPAVVPSEVASLLCEVVADGSMPQDGEPLSAEEVELIRRWVALGARLESGADPTASLVRIMPRPVPPQPPDHYPAVIPVSAVAFDPTGTRLASSGYHEVLIWDLSSRQQGDGPEAAEQSPAVRRLSGLPERIHGLAYAPSGEQLAVAAGTPGVLGEAALLSVGPTDTTAAELPLTSLGLADDAFLAVAFTADGGQLAAVAADQTVRLFDMAGTTQLSERADHADWVQGVALSPDGSKLVTASRDATAKVVELSGGKLLTTFAGHREPVAVACWLDDELVASGGADGVVRIWKAENGKEVRSIDGFTGSIEGLCVVAGDRLVIADSSGAVRLHAVADGKKLHTFQTGGRATTCLAVSTDSRLLAVGSLDGSITLFTLDGDLEQAAEPFRWLAAP